MQSISTLRENLRKSSEIQSRKYAEHQEKKVSGNKEKPASLPGELSLPEFQAQFWLPAMEVKGGKWKCMQLQWLPEEGSLA